MTNHDDIKSRFQSLSPFLNERLRRVWAAAEAVALGHGGVLAVAKATEISRRAIAEGKKELGQPAMVSAKEPERIRRAGGGRKSIQDKQPGVKDALEKLFSRSALYTDNQKRAHPLLWNCRGVQALANELGDCGFQVSHVTVAVLLVEMGYSLQANRKLLEGCKSSERDDQFGFINSRAARFLALGQPVISMDFQKCELVGSDKEKDLRSGHESDTTFADLHDKQVRVQVPVDADNDTVTFAIECIRRWWLGMGRKRYPEARALLVTAADSDFNDHRLGVLQKELQRLADELGLSLTVSLLPPGTYKWHRFEHRFFAETAMRWRGRPGINYEVAIGLVARTEAYDDPTSPTQAAQSALFGVDALVQHTNWNFTVRPGQV